MCRLIFYCFFGIIGCVTNPVFGQSEKASLEGLVLDGATRQPVVGARIEAYAPGGRVTNAKTMAPDGSFRLSLSAKELYRVVVQAQGYINSEEQIDFSDPRVVSRVGKTIYMAKAVTPNSGKSPVASGMPPAKPKAEPVATNSIKKVNPTPPPTVATPAPSATVSSGRSALDPVFFAQSTSDILPESRESLDLLVRYLMQNPGTVVELGGHTDNQGDFDQNVALSRQRAEIVKNYVLSKGAKPNQVRTRGYGGTRPAATNNYEKTRPMNRRVEITILSE